MSPIHIRAQADDLAPYVLLPGDPHRARYIAERYLEKPRQYNENRALWGFTGTYEGVPVSVQTTGMGTPSAAIVVEELATLGARTMIRVGTAGAAAPGIRSGEVVVASGAVPGDGTTRQYLKGAPYAPVPDFDVLRALVASAPGAHVGLILTEDAFYASTPEDARAWAKLGVLAVEMEAAALFLLGKMRGFAAGAILAVSNNIGDPELVEETVLKRAVDGIIEAALAAILRLEGKA